MSDVKKVIQDEPQPQQTVQPPTGRGASVIKCWRSELKL